MQNGSKSVKNCVNNTLSTMIATQFLRDKLLSNESDISL